jgi:hypothetical protein
VVVAAQASTAPRAYGYMVRGGVKDQGHARGWSKLVPQLRHIGGSAMVRELAPSEGDVLRCAAE